jgi:hypothetical protein
LKHVLADVNAKYVEPGVDVEDNKRRYREEIGGSVELILVSQ